MKHEDSKSDINFILTRFSDAFSSHFFKMISSFILGFPKLLPSLIYLTCRPLYQLGRSVGNEQCPMEWATVTPTPSIIPGLR